MSQTKKGANKLSKEDLRSIADAVAESLEDKFDKLQACIEKCASKEDVEQLKANVRVNRYEHDRLEQYTRRENVRIHNWSFDESRPLTPQIVCLLNDMVEQGVAEGEPDQEMFQVSDISTCHGIGSKNKKQTIVRFISRAKVNVVFKLKKYLKKSTNFKGAFITEDLTVLRLKLRETVKNNSSVTNVYTINGNIHATYKGKKVVLSSPDDLFKVDMSPDLEALGLGNLA